MALDHHAHHVIGAPPQLLGNAGQHLRLSAEVFVAVGVAAIHHQTVLQTGLAQLGCGLLHSLQVVVAASAAAAQNKMSVGIARGAHNRGMALAVDPQKMVGF